MKYRGKKRYIWRRRILICIFSALLISAVLIVSTTIAGASGGSRVIIPVGEDPDEVIAAVSPAEPGGQADSAAPQEPADGENGSPGERTDGQGEKQDPPAEQDGAPFGQPLPESEPVDDSFFDDAVFFGNSRTEGLLLYTGLAPLAGIASRGVMVDTALTKRLIAADGAGEKQTMIEALAGKQGVGKVYVMMGLNELGWAYERVFIQKYGELIDRIREVQPGADIYVQSILPVTKEKSDGDPIYNRKNIERYNALIAGMAREKGVYFVDAAAAVSEDGYLPAAWSTDGVHLNKEACDVWLTYLKTHTASK